MRTPVVERDTYCRIVEVCHVAIQIGLANVVRSFDILRECSRVMKPIRQHRAGSLAVN